jgi:hypothetical protein
MPVWPSLGPASGRFPLTVAGVICILGACVYLFILGEIKPLPALDALDALAAQRANHVTV